jgi:hypothetical protein
MHGSGIIEGPISEEGLWKTTRNLSQSSRCASLGLSGPVTTLAWYMQPTRLCLEKVDLIFRVHPVQLTGYIWIKNELLRNEPCSDIESVSGWTGQLLLPAWMPSTRHGNNRAHKNTVTHIFCVPLTPLFGPCRLILIGKKCCKYVVTLVRAPAFLSGGRRSHKICLQTCVKTPFKNYFRIAYNFESQYGTQMGYDIWPHPPTPASAHINVMG